MWLSPESNHILLTALLGFSKETEQLRLCVVCVWRCVIRNGQRPRGLNGIVSVCIQRLENQENWWYKFRSKSRRLMQREWILLYLDVCSISASNRLVEAHQYCRGQSALLSLPIHIVITFRKTLKTPRRTLNQIPGDLVSSQVES